MAGGWLKLHNEEVHNLYASQNIIRVIKSREGGHVIPMGEMRNVEVKLFLCLSKHHAMKAYLLLN